MESSTTVWGSVSFVAPEGLYVFMYSICVAVNRTVNVCCNTGRKQFWLLQLSILLCAESDT